MLINTCLGSTLAQAGRIPAVAAHDSMRESLSAVRRGLRGKGNGNPVTDARPWECNLSATRPQVRYLEIGADDAGMRLDNYLLRLLRKVPKSHVYRIVRSGEVRVNRRRAQPSTRLAAGDRVRVPPVRVRDRSAPPRPPDALMARVQSAIIEETEDWIAMNKPAGLAVHGGSGLMFGLIEVLRARRPNAYVELVHRLDRQTSGCLLLAKSRAALQALRAALNSPACSKRYLALLDGHWPAGARRIALPLSRDRERGGERMVVVDERGGRRALSDFSPLERLAHATLMQVTIHTGRTHQIRVHAAHCGHPVAGDDKYGSRARCAQWRRRGLARMFLHAASLELPLAHGRQRIEAPLAADLARLLDAERRLHHGQRP